MKKILLATGGLVAASLLVYSCSTTTARKPSWNPFAKTVEVEPYDPANYESRHGDQIAPGDKAAALGRDIWIKATAGNDRFFTYAFRQRVAGKGINWPDMLLAEKKPVRFEEYGLVNDPDCCSPAVSGECEKKFGRSISAAETFGFDYCPGDDELLKFVGKSGYRDPACDIKNDVNDPNKESSCNLDFGTSTGTVGLRKFPNPRFNRAEWEKSGGWAGYINLKKDASGLAAIDDTSIEPPFRIGMACAHCHAGYSALNPPVNNAFPKWENINTMAGNQYLTAGQIWASGFRKSHVSAQSLGQSRPGTVDTSAIPNDLSGNPGTQNAIINLHQRPLHQELVDTWRKADGKTAATAYCQAGEDDDKCWCEPGKNRKCWRRATVKEKVPHILKGGEDSVGYNPAIQRVYFNIGSCSEQCWMNHLPDMTVLGGAQRGFGQTKFDINQCRRDCPQFRAIEDRVDAIGRFFFNARPTDMKDAAKPGGEKLFSGSNDQLKAWLEKEAPLPNGSKGFGEGSVKKGAQLFAQRCATCHSSQAEPGGGFASVAESANPEAFFLREIPDPFYPGKQMRADWLGNDKLVPVTVVGTNSCRARHSNHMKGSIYEEYASETYRGKEPVRTGAGPVMTGGRGSYRNISLLNVWAHAPFMHNNAVGPELCGNPSNPKWYSNAFLNRNEDQGCQAYDTSFDGRFKLYVQSMNEMLTPPASRPKKALRTYEPMNLELIPTFWSGQYTKDSKNTVSITFPAGIPAAWIAGFRHKEFMEDFARYLGEAKSAIISNRLAQFRLSDEFKASLQSRFGSRTQALLDNFNETAKSFIRQGLKGSVDLDNARLSFYLQTYGNCVEQVENGGHDFGTDLSEADKKALTAYLSMF